MTVAKIGKWVAGNPDNSHTKYQLIRRSAVQIDVQTSNHLENWICVEHLSTFRIKSLYRDKHNQKLK